MGKGGLEPPNSSEDRFTVCCNCRYATSPCSSLRNLRADGGIRTPDPEITNHVLWPTELHRHFHSFKQLILSFGLQKYNKFSNLQTFSALFFDLFFQAINYQLLEDEFFYSFSPLYRLKIAFFLSFSSLFSHFCRKKKSLDRFIAVINWYSEKNIIWKLNIHHQHLTLFAYITGFYLHLERNEFLCKSSSKKRHFNE